jgi:hypothetical protein
VPLIEMCLAALRSALRQPRNADDHVAVALADRGGSPRWPERSSSSRRNHIATTTIVGQSSGMVGGTKGAADSSEEV